jgi:hypothetical protein
MALGATDLLTGESVLSSTNANYRISPNEALGGRLHLTSFRLVFEAHPVNRVVGRLGIFLPTIVKLEDTSRLLARRLTVVTTGQPFEFVVWGVPALIARIRAAREALPHEAPARMFAELMAKPAILGADAGFAPIAHLLRQPGFDPREGVLPWPGHPLGAATAVNAVSLAISDWPPRVA